MNIPIAPGIIDYARRKRPNNSIEISYINTDKKPSELSIEKKICVCGWGFCQAIKHNVK